VRAMYTVGCSATLVASTPQDQDQVTDLIESIIDELDKLCDHPSVSTTCDGGTDIHVTIEVVVDKEDALDAIVEGMSCIRSALHTAHVGTAEMVVPTELVPTVRSLEAA
jgi:multidrug efflux pump subunit AcrB